MKNLLSILLMSLSLLHIGHGIAENSWNYKWQCITDGKCVRQHTDTANDDTTYYESQNVCRLVCGQYGALWPQPTGRTTLGNELIRISYNKIRFEIDNDVPAETQSYLEAISDLLVENLQKECHNNCTDEPKSEGNILVRMYVNTYETILTWATDESYSIDISTVESTVTVQVTAQSVFGIRHGLETVSQLVAVSNGPSSSYKNALFMIKSAQIKDHPIFVHRGLSLDTARNFIPVKDIERTLDGMASCKLNIFHWHATDSQSFPLHMPRVPQLTRFGAYSPKHIYSPSDVRHIIKYALHRGIRVLIELDAPSHSGNGWQWGPDHKLGDLAVCINKQPWRSYCIQPPCGQLNPANANLYHVLKEIYRDILDVLPAGETMHMGGDEVHFNCWNTTQEIIDLLSSRGLGRELKDFLQLWAEFQSTSLRLWDEESGRTFSSRDKSKPLNKIILWSSQLTDPEVIENYLQNDRYIIQTWVPSTDALPAKLLDKGYDIIMSTKNAWYFDHGFWGITQYYQWRTVYSNRIPRKRGVLGGEACVWTELIDEETLDSRTWPRLAAVAERLWTDPETNIKAVETRFYRHRNRLEDRGIRPEALAPVYCAQNEGQCF